VSLDALAAAVLRLLARMDTKRLKLEGVTMGFREMKEDFDRDAAEIQKLDVFRRNYLRCLFEIAGNLDTVALCSRAMVEQADKTREILSLLVLKLTEEKPLKKK
jgi:hypothetical protein